MRTTIQRKLNELNDVESGEMIADDIIEDGVTYFGYQLYSSFRNADLDKNYTYRVNITGYVTRRIDPDENTTQKVDLATEEIITKLKELNFKCNAEDVSIENNIRKTRLTGYVDYNEINNSLIL